MSPDFADGAIVIGCATRNGFVYIGSGIIMSMPGVNPCSAGGYVTLPSAIPGCGTTFSETGVNPCLSVAYTWMFLFGVTSTRSVRVSPFAAVAALVDGMAAIC